MKVHYINILLFALPLNIWEHNQRNHKNQTLHTPKIPITRLLCECELYAPANYDNDPQMKEVMENFSKQTQERFEEYDEHMVEKRKRCKDKCDKEIQKIILKDKLEKELMDKFATLRTDIQSDSIPTCICEKSMADKVEKDCLRCGGVLGGGVAPSVGLLGGIGIYGWIKGVPEAVATKYAMYDAAFAATKAGMREVTILLKDFLLKFPEITVDLKQIVTPSSYKCGTTLLEGTKKLTQTICVRNEKVVMSHLGCNRLDVSGTTTFNGFAEYGIAKYDATLPSKIAEFKAKNIAAVNTAYEVYQTTIIASVIAIVVIILIMVIIYKILRYRRKKKMKKKLQYIKLLEE
ncbi:rifin [Plasmodium reichenowi]|uniref:Rifin n=1 Tax=Plasmodium reichenowi TaxID=5854 RepID=A0A060RQD4_PLARE|nr:rifin [Plasmodium reichenowi]